MAAPDSKDEAVLIAAVKEASDLVHDGLTPDEAIIKVASERRLTPGMINVLCQGYNTGRQLQQMRSSDTAVEKFASFPLANPSRVIAAVYAGGAKKAAAAPPAATLARRQEENARQRAGLTKAASAPLALVEQPPGPLGPPEPGIAMQRAYATFQRAKRAFEEKRRHASAMEDRLRAAITKLAGDVAGGPALATVEAVAVNKYGDAVRPLFDALAASPALSRQKRAADACVIRDEVNFRRPPFSTLDRCVELGREAATARREREEAYEQACKAAEDCGLPFGKRLAAESGEQPSRRQPSYDPSEEGARKEAFLTSPAFGIAAGNAVGKMIGDVPKTKSDMIEDQWLELEDPSHHNELRKIRAHAMLNSMMTDPEDPISGFDPDQVVTAFNEINQLAPRLAEQPAVMRPLLQRRLQGNVQPFEAKEIADIEKGIAATRARTPSGSLLHDAPNSLLG